MSTILALFRQLLFVAIEMQPCRCPELLLCGTPRGPSSHGTSAPVSRPVKQNRHPNESFRALQWKVTPPPPQIPFLSKPDLFEWLAWVNVEDVGVSLPSERRRCNRSARGARSRSGGLRFPRSRGQRPSGAPAAWGEARAERGHGGRQGRAGKGAAGRWAPSCQRRGRRAPAGAERETLKPPASRRPPARYAGTCRVGQRRWGGRGKGWGRVAGLRGALRGPGRPEGTRPRPGRRRPRGGRAGGGDGRGWAGSGARGRAEGGGKPVRRRVGREPGRREPLRGGEGVKAAAALFAAAGAPGD